MPIPVICSCTAKLRVGDHLRGKQIQCPKCGTIYGMGPTGGVPKGKAPVASVASASVLAESGMSAAEQERLQKELEKDEMLLWAGKPKLGSVMMVHGFVGCGLIAFGGIAGGMGLYMALKDGEAEWHKFITVGFGGVFVLFAFIWPLLIRRRYRRCAYALTSKRALVWDAGILRGPRFQEYDPADMARYKRQDVINGTANGVGHLIFAVEVKETRHHRSERHHGLLYVERIGDLERLLRQRLIDPYMDHIYE